ITNGSLNDVIEIDAASNNGVEDVRVIRDTSIFPPTIADYKVYIIDEVHMLSTAAFNALLKTLEEPPSNVVFILATTEVHKVPATILSRAQRFDFKKITTLDIVEHLRYILTQLNVAYEEEALFIIARSAQGGMRDALSILDMAIIYSDEKVSVQDANSVTGSLTYENMEKYLVAIVEKNTQEALHLIEEILAQGKEAKRFLEDVLLYLRDLLLYQQAPKMIEEKFAQVRPTFIELSQQLTTAKIFKIIEVFNTTNQEIRFSNNAQIQLEVATVKILDEAQTIQTTDSASQQEIDILKQDILVLQKEIVELRKNGTQTTSAKKQKPVKQAPSSSYKEPVERVLNILPTANKAIKEEFKNVWGDLLNMLTIPQKANFMQYSIGAATPTQVVLVYQKEVAFLAGKVAGDEELKEAVKHGLARLTQYSPELIPMTTEGWSEVLELFKGNNTQNQEEAPEAKDDFVDRAMEMFGDVVDIKDE
ncbi:MAG: DNA polymerase III subunit gamma/tau, partial [Streptococcaceae bacterium]|nr:DNA polymerase III subunit gamma/tau [Streptococcaceae bacterium]